MAHGNVPLDDRFVPWPWSVTATNHGFVGRPSRYVQDGDAVTEDHVGGRVTLWHDYEDRIIELQIEPSGSFGELPASLEEVDSALRGRTCRYVRNGSFVTQDFVQGRVTIWHEDSRIVKIQIEQDPQSK